MLWNKEQNPPRVVLASRSPRRQELLRQMGIREFEIHPAVGEERCPDSCTPDERVRALPWGKQCEVRKSCGTEPLLLAADTLVFLDDAILGKPKDEADALRMLLLLQGRSHTVRTGVSVAWGEREACFSVSTEVFFLPASEEELWSYIRTGEPMDKAGAYGIQGRGALLIERIDGDFYNVMGLPIARLAAVLRDFGWTLFS